MNKRIANTSVLVVVILGSLVLLNILSGSFFFRLDSTKNKQFTLSKATKEVLGNLKDPLTVRAYLTEDMPAKLLPVTRYIKDLLADYYAESRGMLRYEVIDPTAVESDSDKQKKRDLKRGLFGDLYRESTGIEQELMGQGIKARTVQDVQDDQIVQKSIYMSMVLSFGDKKEVIPWVGEPDELENELTTLARKMSRTKEPKIGYISGHGSPDLQNELKNAHELLQRNYNVVAIDLAKDKQIAADVDALLVVGPKSAFTEEELKAIDSFIQTGRSATFLLSPVSVEVQSLQATPTEHNLKDLLASYGIKIDPGLVLDVECAPISVATRQGSFQVAQQVRYPFMLMPKALGGDHPLTRGISEVVFPFTGPLSAVTDGSGKSKVDILARSSKKSWLQQPPFNLDPFQEWTEGGVGEMKSSIIMLAVSGQLKSPYAGTEKKEGVSSRVVVVGGSEFVGDQFFAPGNRVLLLNLVDWMVTDESLLDIRTRGLAAAPLEEISDTSKGFIRLANTMGLPLAFILFGLIRWRLRETRRKTVRL